MTDDLDALLADLEALAVVHHESSVLWRAAAAVRALREEREGVLTELGDERRLRWQAEAELDRLVAALREMTAARRRSVARVDRWWIDGIDQALADMIVAPPRHPTEGEVARAQALAGSTETPEVR